MSSSLVVGGSLWYGSRRARRRSWGKEASLQRIQRLEKELGELRAAVGAMVDRHLPAEKHPRTVTESVIALDGVLCGRAEENELLHRRLVDTIRNEHTLYRKVQELQARARELERAVPTVDLRAELEVVRRERDALWERVQRLSPLLKVAEGGGTDRLVALARQNESLRGELHSARRLIKALETQVHLVESGELLPQPESDATDGDGLLRMSADGIFAEQAKA